MCQKAAGRKQELLLAFRFSVLCCERFPPHTLCLRPQPGRQLFRRCSSSSLQTGKSVSGCSSLPSKRILSFFRGENKKNKSSLLFAELGPTRHDARERNGRRRGADAAQACRTSSADTGLFTSGVQCLTGHEITSPLSKERSSPPRLTWRNRADAASSWRFN